MTVMLYVPATAVEATVKVSAEVPAPVIDVGLNAARLLPGGPDTWLAYLLDMASRPAPRDLR